MKALTSGAEHVNIITIIIIIIIFRKIKSQKNKTKFIKEI